MARKHWYFRSEFWFMRTCWIVGALALLYAVYCNGG
jgi:hypothetical protein